MAQRPSDGHDSSPRSTRPPLPNALESPESGHPALQAGVVDTPVTPGIGPGAYDATPAASPPSATPAFAEELARRNIVESGGEAAQGQESNQDILRRISLSGIANRRDSVKEMDPRAANPSLGLSGGVISATFCIPHALKFTKGSEWVCYTLDGIFGDVMC